MLFETLEGRLLLANSITFAVIGDYGSGSANETAVANQVKSWQPEFIITTGDNNYPSGAANTIDRNIGFDYHSFIYPYTGSYGAGSADETNRFFPTMGNHDWMPGGQPYLDYFTLPGNERYYSFVRGPVQFFAIDSDPSEPDLGYVNDWISTETSTEALWLKNALASSTARYKIVYFHHAPYSSSSTHGDSQWMQWPFKQWGATAVLSGHDHTYERLLVDGLPYFVNGIGGYTTYGFGTPADGSQVRYNSDFGAQRVTADAASIKFDFITRTGETIDTYSIYSKPTAPVGLVAKGFSTSQINLSWRDNENESSYILERSANGSSFARVATLPANTTTYQDKNRYGGRTYYYRLRAVNHGLLSPWATAPGSAIAPLPALPVPWVGANIGAAAVGRSGFASNVFTVSGAGAVSARTDSYRFVYRTLGVNGSIVARLTSFGAADPRAVAGIAIRQDLTVGSRVASVLVSDSGVASFESRATPGGTAVFSGKRAASNPQWLKLTRTAGTIRGYVSANGTTWAQIGSTRLTLPGNVLVGLFVSSRSLTSLGTATFDRVAVQAV